MKTGLRKNGAQIKESLRVQVIDFEWERVVDFINTQKIDNFKVNSYVGK